MTQATEIKWEPINPHTCQWDEWRIVQMQSGGEYHYHVYRSGHAVMDRFDTFPAAKKAVRVCVMG